MEALSLSSSNRDFADEDLTDQTLSKLLWAALGINSRGSGLRTAQYAVDWMETDIYVVMRKGVYTYDAASHSLKPVLSGDLRAERGTQQYVKDAAVNLVYVANASRMTRPEFVPKTHSSLGFLSLAHIFVVIPLAQARAAYRVASNRKVGDRAWELTLESEGGRAIEFAPGQFAWLKAPTLRSGSQSTRSRSRQLRRNGAVGVHDQRKRRLHRQDRRGSGGRESLSRRSSRQLHD